MPRPSFEREGIEAEIDRVRSLGVDSLRTLWRTTIRSSPPPAFSKDILARFLCWHIQELASDRWTIGLLRAQSASKYQTTGLRI
jgi:hypothetical protein